MISSGACIQVCANKGSVGVGVVAWNKAPNRQIEFYLIIFLSILTTTPNRKLKQGSLKCFVLLNIVVKIGQRIAMYFVVGA